MAYIPLRKAVEFLGLHPNTLRRYADEGKIKSIKNPAGQRLYDVESYIKGSSTSTPSICYCRVSSSKQRDDLDRQIAYMQSLYPEAEIIKDIGSGLNFKRKGLRSLLDRLLQGDKFTLVIACRDRLARFGFELVQYMVEQNGGQIVVLDKTVHCPQSELTQDLLSILHVFSCRMHGLRKYSKKIKEDLSQTESYPEAEN
ncbi:IS607 family transposase [Dolichospermum sp. UHCC 0352]|jgi:predicted site-specific integrase-resolvase|uniref:IS607 family transposase n=1 Tax=Nostocales TaxID=1161 RepID=UPI00029B7A92|nr:MULTISPECIES: IS607 family transposase [Nostocales]AFW94839.1 site-specific integrase-resolvase [Anabaena sp. 90]MBO1054862.1 IS607 family transposase [Dolichospermum sp. DET73]MTJ20199.1 IS607 family transposase [Dolichospermum sp. UHCC 0352]